MNNSLAVAVIACAALLAACGNKNDPTESNLGAAISAGMEGDKGALCLRGAREAYAFPVTVADRDLGDPTAAGLRQQLGALEKHGLIGRLPAGKPDAREAATVFSLTDEGRKSAMVITRRTADANPQDAAQAWKLCFGKARLDKVDAWTQPDPATHRSQVTYTYRVDELASWAKESDVRRAFPEIDAATREAGETKLHVVLEQRPDGWVRVN
ncbi:hypothetical protein B0G84_4188 [Paraburkholderia sp. BL8N3]|jgi:hypothetical protein|nr:hypothetical protein [Paraburkholderia sp. BL8N3]TCK38864.1 hypothetical protein B0G84_4188 [Paraburkholderia sp. BL8N3]